MSDGDPPVLNAKNMLFRIALPKAGIAKRTVW